MAPLEDYRLKLGERPFAPPHFDPFDGGVTARLLLLLETPGPSRASVRFVSRDNPTGTAANLRRAFAEANVERSKTLLWNTAPWVLHPPGSGSRTPSRADLAAGLDSLPGLLGALPRLRAVVLAGRIAAAAGPVVMKHAPDLKIVRIAHPSPTWVNTRPSIFGEIVQGIAAAAKAIDS